MPSPTLDRQGLADRLDASFAGRGAPTVTLLQFEVDRGAASGGQQQAAAAALRARVRGGDLVACLDDGAVVVGCVGAAPSVTALLLERLRAAVVGERGAGVGLSPGLALFCATRERCTRALDEIDRVQGLHAAAEVAATAAALLQGVERRDPVTLQV